MKESQLIEWKETWRDEYLRWILRSCAFGPLSPVHLPRETYEMRLISPASVWAERVRERGRI